MRMVPWWLMVLVMLLAAPASYAQTYPDHTDVYLNDFARILTADEAGQIRQALIGLYDQTGIEAVVVTMDTMRAYGHSGEIEPFATGLFNHWGVGNAQLNSGVMVLVARADRQMRIELGAGYPQAMDADMQRIIDRQMLPEFREGRYGAGITAGVDELVLVLQDHKGMAAPIGFMDQVERKVRDLSAGVMAAIAAAVAGLLALGTRLFQIWQRRYPPDCPVDGNRMVLLPEDQDDARMLPGQTVEERVGSVDHDVWTCPSCNHVTIRSYRRWFSQYGACRTCNFRTLQGTTTILQEATKSSSGLKRIDYNCHNCSSAYSETKTIPKIKESSGSGRSSFGGGRSSGGGASGRW
jgi:uncharacterized protein